MVLIVQLLYFHAYRVGFHAYRVGFHAYRVGFHAYRVGFQTMTRVWWKMISGTTSRNLMFPEFTWTAIPAAWRHGVQTYFLRPTHEDQVRSRISPLLSNIREMGYCWVPERGSTWSNIDVVTIPFPRRREKTTENKQTTNQPKKHTYSSFSRPTLETPT